MKIGRIILNIIKKIQDKEIIKRRKTYPNHNIFNERLDIPYIDDNNPNHKFDLYYSKPGNKRNLLVIHIHGGSYMFGDKMDSYPLALEFLYEGFDFASVNYIVNDGKKDTLDLVKDCYTAIKYIVDHLKELDITYNNIAILGDSAGGHLALLISEIINNDNLREQLKFDKITTNLVATLLNCPVYDYEVSGYTMKRNGAIRMFGPSYFDKEHTKMLSPRTHIKEFNIPLFVSTCKNDFLRNESLLIKEDYLNKESKLELIDLDVDDKNIGHVHNLVNPSLKESKYINDNMIAFLVKLINQ